MMTQIKLIKIQDEASRVQTFSKIYFCFGNKKGLPEVNGFFCQKFSVRKKYVKRPTFRFDVGIPVQKLKVLLSSSAKSFCQNLPNTIKSFYECN
jgi:hypothetical protein